MDTLSEDQIVSIRWVGTSSVNKEMIQVHCSLIFTVVPCNLDNIKVFYLPTDAQYSCFKRTLKFTLKQLLHVSVQSSSSESVLFELAKVIVIKIIS